MRISTTLFGLLLIAAAVATSIDSASATRYGHRGARAHYHDGAIITAESQHGNGVISAPIRIGRGGWEVRLPHGTWVGCRRSCEETLRVETVDIFETDGRMVGYGTFQNQCGVFGCLEITVPR